MTKDYARHLLINSGHSEYRLDRFVKNGNYTLRHGEFEMPDYQVRKVRGKDEYEIFARFHFYVGTLNAPVNHVLSDEELTSLRVTAIDRALAEKELSYYEKK